jgi:hypothetical protein
MGEQPSLARRCFVGEACRAEMDGLLGNFAIDGLQELLELDRAVAGVQRADDRPVVMFSAALRLEVPARL